MFWPDVIALKEFYSSALGQIVSLTMRNHIRRFWGELKGDSLLGVGFCTPYLQPFLDDTKQVFACMPAGQGVMHWPADARNLTVLSDEGELPFADNSIARVLVIHALENSEQVRPMLSEIWRVLSPSGRLLAIVPNRRGIWARSPRSPFAYGQPFTSWQLRQLLAEHSFTPLRSEGALFFPPRSWSFMLRSARMLEIIGSHFFPAFGGVQMLEAEKQIYAPVSQKARIRARKTYVPVAQPIGM